MNRDRVFTSMVWRFAERIGAQAVALVVNIVMARLLAPEDYGVIALGAVFIVILNVVADSGIGSALIQKDRVDPVDYNTAFYFHLAVSILLYAVLFAAAPRIAAFYREEELTPVIRVLSLSLILGGFRAVPEAYVIRNLRLKLYFYSTLTGTVVSAVIGIWMAFRGYGVWALVAQQMINTTLDSLVLILASKWRPERCFSFDRLRSLFRFGWMIMAASVAGTLYGNFRQLVIGKFHSAASLGIYNKGEQLPNVVMVNINASLQTALFPVLSASQHDLPRLRDMLRRSIEVSAYVAAPLMAGLFVVAPQAVRFLLTDKWLPTVPFIRVFCLIYFFLPIEESNVSAVKAQGKSGLFLRSQLVKYCIGLLLLFVTMRVSAWAVCLSLIPYAAAVQLINGYLCGKLLGYGAAGQLRSILPPLLLSFFMGLCILPVPMLGLSDLLTILIQVGLGAGIYVLGSVLFGFESYLYLKDLVFTLLKRN